MGRPGSQRIDTRVVCGIGIGAEEHVDRGGDLKGHLGETAPTGAPGFTGHLPPPEHIPLTGGLQPPAYRERSGERKFKPDKGFIVHRHLSYSLNGTPLEVPQIYQQHSH